MKALWAEVRCAGARRSRHENLSNAVAQRGIGRGTATLSKGNIEPRRRDGRHRGRRNHSKNFRFRRLGKREPSARPGVVIGDKLILLSYFVHLHD